MRNCGMLCKIWSQLVPLQMERSTELKMAYQPSDIDTLVNLKPCYCILQMVGVVLGMYQKFPRSLALHMTSV